MNKWIRVLAIAAVAAAGSAVEADTIWSQPGGASGANAGTFWVSDDSLPQTMADKFSIGSASSVTGARWWGTAIDGTALTGISHFVIEIFSVVGGLPGTSQYSTTIAAGSVTTASDAAPDKSGGWKYDASLAGCNLSAGDYYFSVAALASSPNGSGKFVWQGLLDGGDGAAFKNTGTAGLWNLTGPSQAPIDNLAFVLEGTIQTIPLPAPVLLGVAGLLGLIPLRRRMMRRDHD